MWRLNNVLLNNQWVTEKNKEEVKSLETNENRSMMIQNLWDAADAVLTGSFIVISYLRKKKNLKQPKLTPKGTGEKRTKSKVSRRKEILKIRAETNEKQMKKTIEQMNETKSWFFEKK